MCFFLFIGPLIIRSSPGVDRRGTKAGTSRPATARRAGNIVAILRTSSSQPAISSPPVHHRRRPVSAVVKYPNETRVTTGGAQGDVLAAKHILNWYRLPATGGWVPCARLVSRWFHPRRTYQPMSNKFSRNALRCDTSVDDISRVK